MYRILIPFFLILTGIVLCLKRNFPRESFRAPNFGRQQNIYGQFAVIDMLRKTESRIKEKPLDTSVLTKLGIAFTFIGIALAVIFYFNII